MTVIKFGNVHFDFRDARVVMSVYTTEHNTDFEAITKEEMSIKDAVSKIGSFARDYSRQLERFREEIRTARRDRDLVNDAIWEVRDDLKPRLEALEEKAKNGEEHAPVST